MSECLAGWPLSPKSHCENEGYNSADEQGAFYGLPYDNAEKEHQFEIDIRHLKDRLGYELDQLENPSPLETEARVRSSLPVKRSEVLWKQPLYLR
ncbi:hypothetical protein Tco_1297271 [Tanacetum coccineum]